MNYKDDIKEIYLNLHWSKWSSLGVQTHIDSDQSTVDIEALIISTFFLGLTDKRLFLAMLSWIESNAEWISLSRMKRMVQAFLRKNQGEDLIDWGTVILDLVKNPETGIEKLAHKDPRYKDLLRGYHSRQVDIPVSFNKRQLLQLYHRSVFGINARGDILMYLMGTKEQNANRLAREIYYDQKAVYRVLLNWEKSEIVKREETNREVLFSLYKWKGMTGFMGISDFAYKNWLRIFIILRQAFNIIMNPDIGDDPYLLSSRLREIYPGLVMVSKLAGFELDHSANYPGESLWHYFRNIMIRIFKAF